MSSKKLEGIQILRGYAAILVVVTHLWSVGLISSALRFGRIGGLGVDIFFIISGFIMCYSLGERLAPGDSFEFLKKRVHRVYPVYLIVLIPFLVEYLNHCSAIKAPIDSILIVGNLLLLPSFFGGEDYRMLVGPAWTLSYELFFYALFAGAISFSKSKNRAIYTVMICIVVMVVLVNLFGLKGERLQWVNVQYMVGDTLFFNFVIGCICYFLWRKYGRIFFNFWTAIGSALVLTVMALALAKAGLPRLISLGVPAGGIVLIFLFAEFKTGSVTKLLLLLGSASYSIYLVHAMISNWKYLVIGGTVRENDVTGFLLTVGAAAAGCIFYVIVEKPISRILHKRSRPPLQVALPLGKP
jgi:peptidoglycan/LPS O-acetylase OafA/YrhL